MLVLASILQIAQSHPLIDAHKAYVSKVKHVSEIKSNYKSATCSTFVCASEGLPDNTCIKNNNGSYELLGCQNGNRCLISLDTPYSGCFNVTYTENNGNPGDSCSIDADCAGFHNCQNGICQGLKTGNCNDQDDCAIGYVCQNEQIVATCQPQIAEGQACGTYTSNKLCQNGYQCNLGSCQSYLNKGRGSIVEGIYAADFCETGFWVTVGDQSNGFRSVCIDPPTSPSLPLPIQCTPGSYCYSADGMYAMECQCGVNAKGNAYCPLFPGDSLYQNYLQALKAYFTPSNLKNCHILNVGSQTCTTQPDLYTNLIKAKKEVDFFVAKVGNSECINETINWSYYN